MNSWELPYCSCEHLCKDSLAQPHSFSLLRLKTDDLVVDFLVEHDSVNVVKQTEQMSLRDRKRRDPKNNQLQGEKKGRKQEAELTSHLYGVRVRGLAQDLQQSGVRHKEKTREHQTLLLQVTRQRLLTELQLLQEVGEDLEQERRPWLKALMTRGTWCVT